MPKKKKKGKKKRKGYFLVRKRESTFLSFFSIVFNAFAFFSSNIRVPAASSIMAKISGGFMLRTATTNQAPREESAPNIRIRTLGDASLHDEEMRIVDVELHRVKEILNAIHLRIVPIYEVLISAADHDLNV